MQSSAPGPVIWNTATPGVARIAPLLRRCSWSKLSSVAGIIRES